MLPRCSRVADVLDARTAAGAAASFTAASLDALAAIFTQSYVSLAAVLAMYALCFCLAKGGGYGTIPHGAPPPPPGQRVPFWDKLAIRWGPLACSSSRSHPPCKLCRKKTMGNVRQQAMHKALSCGPACHAHAAAHISLLSALIEDRSTFSYAYTFSMSTWTVPTYSICRSD